jgi:chromosome segregation ATPase
MSGGERAGADEDPRVEALLRANAELAAEIRGLQNGRIERARSAASPSARRLGRLLSDHDAVIAERDRLAADLEQLRAEFVAQEERLRLEAERASALEEEQQRLIGKIAEYGELAEELKGEIDRLRGGVVGLLRRSAGRVTPGRRRSDDGA